MGVLEEATKYKFKNIGKASAVTTFAALAAISPAWLAFTQSFWGKCFFTVLCWFYTALTSIGVIVINVGIDYVKVLSEKNTFDGTMESAINAVDHGGLTPEQGAAIDDSVIHAHNEFGGIDTH